MKSRKKVYLAHRWLGLVVSLQLLAWSTGGLIFSVFDITMVRGEEDMAMTERPLGAGADFLAPHSAVGAAMEWEAGADGVESILLIDRGLGPAYELRSAYGELLAVIDAQTGARRESVNEQQAIALAQADFAHEAEAVSAILITENPPVEYRNGPLPAWRIRLDHPRRPHIYILADNGQVTSRRNRQWRIFDFFWMLHTMDYAGRDNFNNRLLTTFSVLAIMSAASGLALWGWRVAPKRKRDR